jgi:formylglycine-generating enzyme required for sulfatase activity
MQKDIINIRSFNFVRIPSGKFIYGIDPQKIAPRRIREKFQRTENLGYDFWMSIHPVTNDEYNYFVSGSDYVPVYKGFRSWWEFDKNPGHLLPDHPAGVNWYDAMAYSNWLSEYFRSMLPLGYIIRIPSEQEWEKAARGTNGYLWPWGNLFNSTLCNTEQSHINDTTPVGKYSPLGDSPYGIADLVGNISEWTLDKAPEPFSNVRITKGGDYNQAPVSCDSWYSSNEFDRTASIRLVISKEIKLPSN